jgi:glycosyltransferase involved in cell wall biosynthesis
VLIVNGRFLTLHITGIERYGREMLDRLPPETTSAVVPGRALYGLGGHTWEQLVLPGRIPSGALLWSPANWGPVRVQHQILTLHDVAVLDHPEWFSARVRVLHRVLQPRLAATVQHVITDSEFSKSRIAAHFGLDEGAVTVVYPGVGVGLDGVRDPEPGPPDRVRPYVLANAGRDPRKNLLRLVDAWELARPSLPEFTLKVFGADSSVFARQHLSSVPEGIELLGYVDDDELNRLYRGASAFAYPSLYEGFGLPPLEAMARGVPVIVSDIPVFREVVGDAALLVDPLDPAEIAAGILEVVTDSQLRARLAAASKAAVARYSWDAAATALMNVVTDVQNRTP